MTQRATYKGHGKPEQFLFAGWSTLRVYGDRPRCRMEAGPGWLQIINIETGEKIGGCGTATKFYAEPVPTQTEDTTANQPEEATVNTTPTTATTKEIGVGEYVRLANRPADMTDQIVQVTQVVGARNKAAIYTIDGLYAEVGYRAKFEIHPAPAPKPAPKPAKTAPAVKAARGARIKKQSGSQLRALGKLIASEGGSLTRKDLDADPMVVIALETRGQVTVDRSGDQRSTDLIEITPAGRRSYATGGSSAVVPSPNQVPVARCSHRDGCTSDAVTGDLCGLHAVLGSQLAMAN